MSKRQVKKEQRDRIEAWRKDAETLSYEEAIQALDLLLAELQNDSVPLADLQHKVLHGCLLYTSPSPRDRQKSRMPSSA